MVRRDELRGTVEGEPDERKLGVAEQILGWFANEVGRISKRPRCALSSHSVMTHRERLSSAFSSTDMFVLLSWICGLYTACLKCSPDFSATRPWNTLVGIMASFLDLLLDERIQSKKSIQKSALVRTRRALRSVRLYLFESSFIELIFSIEPSTSPNCHEDLVGQCQIVHQPSCYRSSTRNVI